MYLDNVPNHGSDKTTLLVRESYWEDGKIRKHPLVNITKLPSKLVEQIKQLLKHQDASILTDRPQDVTEVMRALQHGHVAAVCTFSSIQNDQQVLQEQPSPLQGALHHNSVICKTTEQIRGV